MSSATSYALRKEQRGPRQSSKSEESQVVRCPLCKAIISVIQGPHGPTFTDCRCHEVGPLAGRVPAVRARKTTPVRELLALPDED